MSGNELNELLNYIKQAKEHFNGENYEKTGEFIRSAEAKYNAVKWRTDYRAARIIKKCRSEIAFLKNKLQKIQNTEKANQLIDKYNFCMQTQQYEKARDFIQSARALVGYSLYAQEYNNALKLLKTQKQEQERQAISIAEEQAEIHYKNALKYKEEKKYGLALEENKKASKFARDAGIMDNKFVILTNQIIEEKNTKISDKKQSAPSNTTKKTTKRVNVNRRPSISSAPSENYSELTEYDPDGLIKLIDFYINQGELEKAEKYIQRGYKTVGTNSDYNIKFERLSEEVIWASEKPMVTKLIYNMNFDFAIKTVEKLIAQKPENFIFDKKLLEVKKLVKDCQILKELYREAVKLYHKGDYDDALSTVQTLIDLSKNKPIDILKFKNLENNIKHQINNKKAIAEAEEIYNRMVSRYESGDIDYEIIIYEMDMAVSKNDKKIYKEFLEKVRNEYNHLQGQGYYRDSIDEYEKQRYSDARLSIVKALELEPKNEQYLNQQARIEKAIEEFKQYQLYYEHYEAGLNAYKNGSFERALEHLDKAFALKLDNKECEKLLVKVRSGKIDITMCTKRGLKTIEFINEDDDLADKIITARDEHNVVWYNYLQFSNAFNLQPAQYIEVEEKILFPPEPNNTFGRTLDL